MAIYMIGYDLHPKRGETYDDLIDAIKKLANDWWHCLDSTWLIETNQTAAQVRDALLKHINQDDQLLVMKYDKPSRQAAWFGFKDRCQEWLKENL